MLKLVSKVSFRFQFLYHCQSLLTQCPWQSSTQTARLIIIAENKGSLYCREETRRQITNAALSAKTESATSFAVHVPLSFDFKNCELGGPIWIEENKITNLHERTNRKCKQQAYSIIKLTVTEMMRLSIMSTRSDTMRSRASAASYQYPVIFYKMHVNNAQIVWKITLQQSLIFPSISKRYRLLDESYNNRHSFKLPWTFHEKYILHLRDSGAADE